LSRKVLDITFIMIILIYKSWLNFVPAAAVIQRRLVLIIFIRFKGYLDSIMSLI